MSMVMIRAVVRPEKSSEVMSALMYAGFPAVTKMDVYGRGKQRGMRIGDVHYDELPKELLLTVRRRGRQGPRRRHHHQGGPDLVQGQLRRRQDLRVRSRRGLHHLFRQEGSLVMKEVLAIIRMDKMNATKRALAEAGISSLTARKVVGRGRGNVDYVLLQGGRGGSGRGHRAAWPRSRGSSPSGCSPSS